MANNDSVGVQADITSVPSAALSTVGFAQGLLCAVSSDNVSPSAVIQVQALGSCFQSNCDWAARAPDLLTRTPSARLDRLSAWIGWAKGDVPALMSETAGERTASLLCLALCNLYPKDRCGKILLDLSHDVLPSEAQTSGLYQLGDVCTCLGSKLECLGFGNHLASQVSRLRQYFFDAGQEYPDDMVDIPTEEVMRAFLVCLRDILREDTLVLHYSGSQCVATFLALVLALCPEDVRVEVDGGVIIRGLRDSIIFTITHESKALPRFNVQQRINPHTDDFSRNHIVKGSKSMRKLSFSWDNMLSSQLDLAFAEVGPRPTDAVKQALATLVASMVMYFRAADWLGTHYNNYKSHYPPEGLKTILGPRFRQLVAERLERVLARPSDTPLPFSQQYETLHDAVAFSLPFSLCTCGICETEPWKPASNSAEMIGRNPCPVARTWLFLAGVVEGALACIFVHASTNVGVGPRFEDYRNEPMASFLFERGPGRLNIERVLPFPAEHLHRTILRLTKNSENLVYNLGAYLRYPLCTSSDASTIYPTTLEFREIISPWTVQYNLMDGKLQYGRDQYHVILPLLQTNGPPGKFSRRTSTFLSREGQAISPSSLGEHTSLTMTLQPAFISGSQALILMCSITQSNRTIKADFEALHLGLMQLAPAVGCEHMLTTPFLPTKDMSHIKATSSAEPVSGNTSDISITLTQRSGEAQFLCCDSNVKQLYQGDCCIACAVSQAKEKGYSVVIGGSPSRYQII